MPDDFDPYHVWLGIPPDEQPANRYRLLGIRAFESNPDVIDNAADRQTVHLRTFQSGRHAVLTQRLLNEVASARVCLLNLQTKAAYDQQLRAALAAVTPPSPVASPFAPATARGPGGSQIGRAQPANLPVARPIETPSPQAAPQPQAGSNWDDLIGTHETGPRKPTGKSAQSAVRRKASNRLVYTVVGGVLIAAVGIAALLYAINANADAALTFDWPDADRAGAKLAIDGEPVSIPASGQWEFHCPPGEHRVVAQRPAFKLDQQVSVSASDRHPIVPDWKPKAVLVLNWPLAERSGAALTVDGRPTVVSPRDPVVLPVEPGSHIIRIARSGAEPLEATVSVASDRRQSVSLQASKPATLVINWTAEERESAKLIIDNKEQPLDAPQLEFPLNPGRHTVRLMREGFESVNQVVEVGAAALKPITPVWIRKAATAATGGPTPTEPAPSTDVPEPPGAAANNVAKKKLPVPSDAEQQRITKQLDEDYKTEPLPEKQRALAEQLFTLADQPGTSPDERYMVLMKAVGLATKVWDLNSASHGVDLLDADYEVDSFEIKQRLIDDAVRLADSPEHAAAVLTAAEQIIEQAVAEERYDNALAMADAANKALNKLPAESRARKDAADRLTRRRREIVVLQTASATAVDAQTALDKTPDDPEANSNLGRWYCFYKGDWDRGLPLSAKGKEGSLKSLAQQELAVNLELKPQLELADGWWDVAQKETGLPRDLVRLHAGEIYQLMLPNLQPGVKKTAVEKRLKEIADLKSAATSTAVTAKADKLRYAVNEYTWKVGQPSVQLIPKNRGFCFLAGVSGHFAGYDEAAAVRLGDDGFWSLDANSGKDSLSAMAISIARLTPAMFKSEIKEYRWKNGDPPVKMLHRNNGICFLSAIEGHFEGSGEEVSVRLADDGYWYLEGKSGQDQLGASAIAMEWAKPGAYSIAAEVHDWSVGDSPVQLLEKGQGFAFLSSVSGSFFGYGEEVKVYLGEDGFWHLSGRSGQASLHATATAIRLSSATIVRDAAVKTATGVKLGSSSSSRSSMKPRQIDLLKLVDLKRDSVSGDWQRNAEDVWCDTAEGARLAFPYVPPKEYDFEVVFTRVTGHDSVGQLCVGGGHQFLWGMSGYRRGKVSGFEVLDGKDARSNATHKEFSIENGQRYTSIVKVRRGQVEAWVDGKLIDAWTTDYHDLEVAAAWALPDARRLGIGAWKSLFTLHSAKVTEITGTGKVLFQPILDSPVKPVTAVKSAAGSSSAFPRGQWVDLLRLVDSTTDAVRGMWSRERGEVTCKPDEFCRLKLPVIVDGGYDLEVEFTRTEGNEDVNFVMPVGPSVCLLMLSAGKGQLSGLDYVDGHSIDDPQNPSAIRPGTLENGRRYKMLASVRIGKDGAASIDVSLQGKPYLPHWQGKPASLRRNSAWILPNAGQPGLGAWKSAVTFHSARLRMISGEAIPESELKKPSFGPKIMKARWGGGNNWADVTVQVRRAVSQGNTVRAKSDFVGADPTPGWRKHLEITYEKDGQQKSVSIDEDREWTRQEYESL